MSISILVSSTFTSFVFCYLYKIIWKKSSSSKKISTGYGAILIVLISLYFINIDAINDIKSNTVHILILFFTLVYWIDDYSYLSSNFRFFIQFIAGCTIGSYLIFFNGYHYDNTLLIFIVAAGLLNVFLTNVVNFYDGSDLNISTFLTILGLVLIFILGDILEIKYYGLIIIGFIIGFSIFNRIPNNIFFGDSGCFAVSSLITFLLIDSIILHNTNFINILIPLSLPVIDVIYVLGLRIYLKESLLSRNYHHIYHKIELIKKNKLYLLPQLINATIIVIFSQILIYYKFSITISLIISSLVSTVIFYFLIRKKISLWEEKISYE